MAKTSLTSMSVEALLKLRDDIGDVLSRKAGQLQSQLAALGDGGWIASGKKVGRTTNQQDEGPKGRAQISESEEPVRNLGWAWRNAAVRLAAEIKKGKKREDFAIDKSAAKAKGPPAKKSRRKQKATESAEVSASA